MAKTNQAVVTFTGGEVDKYTLGRTDLEVHPTTAETMENVFLTTQGAMELAPGTRLVGETLNSGVAIVRPWAFSLEASFTLVFTDEEVQFVSGEGFVTLEGAAATVGTFSDETTTAPTGGDPPPTGGGGGGVIPPDGSYNCTWVEYGEGLGGFWLCGDFGVITP